jgi:hypothetical protein
MGKKFKVIYFTNLAIIIIALFTPIMNLLSDDSYSDTMLIGYYAVFTMLSITFCASFFALNIYRIHKDKQHKLRYTVITILMSIWIIWGTFQLFNGIIYDIVL